MQEKFERDSLELFFEEITNFSQEFLLCWSFFCWCIVFSLDFIHSFYDHKNTKCDNQKIHHYLEKCPIIERNWRKCCNAFRSWNSWFENYLIIRKAQSSCHDPNKRHNNIRYKRGNYLAKCSSDHHSNSEINHIATHSKLSKFFYNRHK